MTAEKRTIAIFDFDDTLVKGDSFKPFLINVAGFLHTLVAFADTLLLFAVRYSKNKRDPVIADFRTFLKAEMLRRLIAGRRVDSLRPPVAQMTAWLEWNKPILKALLEHVAEGHHIVVASGGLDLYLHDLLKNVPVNGLICTTIGVEDGKVTGVMTSGNCVRERKAELVADYMATHGPFEDSWAYGNYPHDIPMMTLTQRRIIV